MQRRGASCSIAQRTRIVRSECLLYAGATVANKAADSELLLSYRQLYVLDTYATPFNRRLNRGLASLTLTCAAALLTTAAAGAAHAIRVAVALLARSPPEVRGACQLASPRLATPRRFMATEPNCSTGQGLPRRISGAAPHRTRLAHVFARCQSAACRWLPAARPSTAAAAAQPPARQPRPAARDKRPAVPAQISRSGTDAEPWPCRSAAPRFEPGLPFSHICMLKTF